MLYIITLFEDFAKCRLFKMANTRIMHRIPKMYLQKTFAVWMYNIQLAVSSCMCGDLLVNEYSAGDAGAVHGMLANPHLRQLLMELDASPAPQQALRRAMNIPVFTEFADECLRICGLRDTDD